MDYITGVGWEGFSETRWDGLDWAGLDLNDSKSAPILELRWDGGR
jgi:hypothetical protein